MKTVKNKRLFILGIIIIVLSLSIVGLLQIQFGTNFASADISYADRNQVATKGLDVIDYNGNKVLATYEFVKLNESECSVRIANKAEATTAYIPRMGTIGEKEYRVTEIAANAFASSPNLIFVKFADSIKKVNNMAFANCANLQFVDLKNVEVIGNSVFYRCPKLEVVVIPKTVTSVGTYVFRNDNIQVEVRADKNSCENWNSLWNSSNQNQSVNYDSKYKSNIQAEYIYDNVSRSNKTIKGLMISSGQPNISDFDVIHSDIFVDEDIVIPREYEFEDGTVLPILAIGGFAFSYSSYNNLIIEYSDEIIEIGTCAFAGAEPINSDINIYINRPVKYKDYEEDYESNSVFWESQVKNIILPKGSNIVSNMFSDCKYLENIFFEEPYNYKSEQKNEFEELERKLTELIDKSEGVVEISEDVDTIGASAFAGAIKINELHLSGNIKNVEETILSSWENSQHVYVDNDAPINYKESPDSDGWHEQWNSNFTNITYKIEFYKINFKTGDYELNLDKDYIDVIYGQAIGSLPELNIEIYENFNGWYYDEELISADMVFNFKHDITVVPNVESKELRVTLNPEGGTEGTSYVYVKYGEVLPEAFQPIKKGYDFKGYFTGKNGVGSKYYDISTTDDRKMVGTNWDIKTDKELFACWVNRECEIQYNGIPAGAINNNPDKLYFEYEIELKAPERRGYAFDGWYWNNQKVTHINKDMGTKIVLEARWIGRFARIYDTDRVVNISQLPYVILELPSRLYYPCTINIAEDVKQVYIYSPYATENSYYINFDIKAQNFNLIMENCNISSFNTTSIHPGPCTILAYTLNLYTYGTVKIHGCDEPSNKYSNGYEANATIMSRNRTNIFAADNLIISGGRGGDGINGGKGGTTMSGDTYIYTNNVSIIGGDGGDSLSLNGKHGEGGVPCFTVLDEIIIAPGFTAVIQKGKNGYGK